MTNRSTDEEVARADKLKEISNRHKAATPGPYMWDVRTKLHLCQLVTAHSGQYYVMDFERWGMQDACPRFQVYEKYEGPVINRGSNGMVRADKLAKPVGGLAYRIGYEEYIDHPDAIAIQKSWEDIDFLLAELTETQRKLRAAVEDLEGTGACFTCKHFRRNGGDCFGAGRCRLDGIEVWPCNEPGVYRVEVPDDGRKTYEWRGLDAGEGEQDEP